MTKVWSNVVDNYERGVVTNDYPLTPLFIPKIVVAIGFTLLVITSVQMMISMIAEGTLPKLHKKMGGDDYGELVTIDIPNAGRLTLLYMIDPEENIVELQKWHND